VSTCIKVDNEPCPMSRR